MNGAKSAPWVLPREQQGPQPQASATAELGDPREGPRAPNNNSTCQALLSLGSPRPVPEAGRLA